MNAVGIDVPIDTPQQRLFAMYSRFQPTIH